MDQEEVKKSNLLEVPGDTHQDDKSVDSNKSGFEPLTSFMISDLDVSKLDARHRAELASILENKDKLILEKTTLHKEILEDYNKLKSEYIIKQTEVERLNKALDDQKKEITEYRDKMKTQHEEMVSRIRVAEEAVKEVAALLTGVTKVSIFLFSKATSQFTKTSRDSSMLDQLETMMKELEKSCKPIVDKILVKPKRILQPLEESKKAVSLIKDTISSKVWSESLETLLSRFEQGNLNQSSTQKSLPVSTQFNSKVAPLIENLSTLISKLTDLANEPNKDDVALKEISEFILQNKEIIQYPDQGVDLRSLQKETIEKELNLARLDIQIEKNRILKKELEDRLSNYETAFNEKKSIFETEYEEIRKLRENLNSRLSQGLKETSYQNGQDIKDMEVFNVGRSFANAASPIKKDQIPDFTSPFTPVKDFMMSNEKDQNEIKNPVNDKKEVIQSFTKSEFIKASSSIDISKSIDLSSSSKIGEKNNQENLLWSSMQQPQKLAVKDFLEGQASQLAEAISQQEEEGPTKNQLEQLSLRFKALCVQLARHETEIVRSKLLAQELAQVNETISHLETSIVELKKADAMLQEETLKKRTSIIALTSEEKSLKETYIRAQLKLELNQQKILMLQTDITRLQVKIDDLEREADTKRRDLLLKEDQHSKLKEKVALEMTEIKRLDEETKVKEINRPLLSREPDSQHGQFVEQKIDLQINYWKVCMACALPVLITYFLQVFRVFE